MVFLGVSIAEIEDFLSILLIHPGFYPESRERLQKGDSSRPAAVGACEEGAY